MAATIALLGDVMLGRKVAERLALVDPADLVSAEVRELTTAADLVVANLECCVSERGERWPEPGKPFFFRAPPAAVGTLTALGVDCVTLATTAPWTTARRPCWTPSSTWPGPAYA